MGNLVKENVMKDESKRRVFSTTIAEDIAIPFRKKCRRECMDMNDVLEVMMDMYLKGRFTIKMIKKYRIKMAEEENEIAGD